jgi:biopolymer transport protein ExbB
MSFLVQIADAAAPAAVPAAPAPAPAASPPAMPATPPAPAHPAAGDPISQVAQTVSDWINTLTSNYEWMHQAVFMVLYVLLVLGTFIIIERFIYFASTLAQARRVARLLDQAKSLDDLPKGAQRGSTAAVVMLRAILTHKDQLTSRELMEDVTDSAFIDAKGRLSAHLWILDTMVTAAPLLGLLGTILGIIDTFTALAQAGISDPAAVSKGIGLALFATALGIATALYGLLFFNIFQERISRITDLLKIILLRIGLISGT